MQNFFWVTEQTSTEGSDRHKQLSSAGDDETQVMIKQVIRSQADWTRDMKI